MPTEKLSKDTVAAVPKRGAGFGATFAHVLLGAVLVLMTSCLSPQPDATAAVDLLHNGRYQQAVKGFTLLLEAQPHNTRWLRLRGFAYDQLGNFRAGAADFTEALKYQPRNVAALNNRGYAYYQLGLLQEALTDYNRSIELDSAFAEAYGNRALVLVALERFPQALPDTERAMRLGETDNSTLWNLKGYSLLKLSQPEAAIQAFDHAIELDSGYTDARKNREDASKALKNP